MTASTRRLLRVVGGIVVLTLAWFFFQTFPSTTYSTTPRHRLASLSSSSGGSRESPSNIHDLFESFQGDFPELRGIEARGFPDENDVQGNWYLQRMAQGREEFDWPMMRKLFVFGDSFSNLNVKYREEGIGNGHPKKLVDKGVWLKWTENLYNVFQNPNGIAYWSFARDGAVISREVLGPRLEKWGATREQLDEFVDLCTPLPGPASVDWHSSDSLFIFAFGINDMRAIARLGFAPEDITPLCQRLAKALVDSMRDLYALGARHVLVLNVSPLEDSPKYRLPSEIGYSVRDIIKSATEQYNDFLQKEMEAFEADSPGVNAMLFDWNTYYRITAAFPEAFGLTDRGRYHVDFKGRLRDEGRMGLYYHDPGHISWSMANLLARSVHGFLLRRSRIFWMSNATDSTLYYEV